MVAGKPINLPPRGCDGSGLEFADKRIPRRGYRRCESARYWLSAGSACGLLGRMGYGAAIADASSEALGQHDGTLHRAVGVACRGVFQGCTKRLRRHDMALPDGVRLSRPKHTRPRGNPLPIIWRRSGRQSSA